MDNKQRVIQEHVPGRQMTLAHIIVNPDKSIYDHLPPSGGKASALGIMGITPAETGIIIADIAMKAAGVRIISMDVKSGSVIVAGTVSEVEASVLAVLEYVGKILNFDICKITKT